MSPISVDFFFLSVLGHGHQTAVQASNRTRPLHSEPHLKAFFSVIVQKPGFKLSHVGNFSGLRENFPAEVLKRLLRCTR